MLGSRTFYQRGYNFDSVFLVDDGKEDPNTTIRQAIIGPPAKRHLKAFRWRVDNGLTSNAGLKAL